MICHPLYALLIVMCPTKRYSASSSGATSQSDAPSPFLDLSQEQWYYTPNLANIDYNDVDTYTSLFGEEWDAGKDSAADFSHANDTNFCHSKDGLDSRVNCNGILQPHTDSCVLHRQDIDDRPSWIPTGARQINRSAKLVSASHSQSSSFPALKWQNGISKEKIAYLYRKLTADWPADLTSETRKNWETRVSKFLNVRPGLVQKLLANDSRVWTDMLTWADPKAMSGRERGLKGGKKVRGNYPATFTWLVGEMLTSDKDEMFERLSKYWGGISNAAIQGRFAQYVEKYGEITSPEPLLDKDDATFQHAADLIFLSVDGSKKAAENPNAGKNDALHQKQIKSAVRKAKQKRLNAARYTTGQAWMRDLSPDEIDKVHEAVSSYWVDSMDRRRVQYNLVSVNDYLQKHQDLLNKIQAGDDNAAWQVAIATVKKTHEMKSRIWDPPEEKSPTARSR